MWIGIGNSFFRRGGATPPDAPTGLAATVVSDSQIDLSWDAVEGATSYKVYYGTDGVTYPYSTTSETNSKSVTGLTQSTIYYFYVVSCNDNLESDASNIALQLTYATALLASSTYWYDPLDLSTVTKDESNNITQLNDKNGSGQNLVPEETRYPLWTSRGLKTIKYGTLTSTLGKVFTLNQPCECYAICMLPTWGSNVRILRGGNADTWGIIQFGTTPQIMATAKFGTGYLDFPLNEYHVMYFCTNNAYNGDIFGVDNTMLTDQNAGPNNAEGISIGGRIGGGFGVANSIFTMVIYRSVFSSSEERQGIIDYLMKYNTFFLI